MNSRILLIDDFLLFVRLVICLSDDEQDRSETNKKSKTEISVHLIETENVDLSKKDNQTNATDSSHWIIETKDKIQVPDLPSKNANLFKKEFEIRSTAIRFGIVEFDVDSDVIKMKENEFEMRLNGKKK